MWSKCFSPSHVTSSRGLRRLIQSQRTRQSKLTSQTRVPRHQLPSDLLAAAHKQMHDGHSLWLFDIIYFPLGCYRKDLKKPLMIYRCGCTRGCFHSLKQPPLAVDVAIAIAGSYCTLALDPLEKLSPPYSV
ncbi:Ras-related protein RABE1c [Zea mays]|uniref:Ras-related protein RABE1c n=2 Tax=Zea mays TaxID=4577 RepID=C0PNB3_MAIZE|nr:unknown [Zea mays]AQK86490.1 Ras-related protein RABE1c [Zea mays]